MKGIVLMRVKKENMKEKNTTEDKKKEKKKKKCICWCCGRTPKEAKKIVKILIGKKRRRLCKECRWYLGEYLNPISTLNYLKKRGYKKLNEENYGSLRKDFPELNSNIKFIDLKDTSLLKKSKKLL